MNTLPAVGDWVWAVVISGRFEAVRVTRHFAHGFFARGQGAGEAEYYYYAERGVSGTRVGGGTETAYQQGSWVRTIPGHALPAAAPEGFDPTVPTTPVAAPPAPRFDNSKPRYCTEQVGEGPHGQVQFCGCAIGEDLKCAACGEGARERGCMWVDQLATRCAAHCPSAAHFGLPFKEQANGGWRDALWTEVVYGEDRPKGGLYYAEMLDLSSGRPQVIKLKAFPFARGSGQTAEEARAELREKMRTAVPAFEEETTKPDAEIRCEEADAAQAGKLDTSDPETWSGLRPEDLANTLAVPAAGDTTKDAARGRALRAAVKTHLEDWGRRWDELEEATSEAGGVEADLAIAAAREHRSAELCALIASIGGVR